jgi:hypothetical protein
MSEQSDFQKKFFSVGTQNTLFTQKEFDEALAVAQAEIMAMAIEASRTAVMLEREECARLVDQEGESHTDMPYKEHFIELAARIRDRIPTQRVQ